MRRLFPWVLAPIALATAGCLGTTADPLRKPTLYGAVWQQSGLSLRFFEWQVGPNGEATMVLERSGRIGGRIVLVGRVEDQGMTSVFTYSELASESSGDNREAMRRELGLKESGVLNLKQKWRSPLALEADWNGTPVRLYTTRCLDLRARPGMEPLCVKEESGQEVWIHRERPRNSERTE